MRSAKKNAVLMVRIKVGIAKSQPEIRRLSKSNFGRFKNSSAKILSCLNLALN